MPYKDPQKIKENGKKYYLKNKEKIKENVKIYWEDNPDKVKTTYLKKYKLTLLEYKNLIEIQNNRCAICNQFEHVTNKGEIKALAIDHNHKTGKVRGLLCHNCNVGLGHLKDDILIISLALKYLIKDSL